MSAPVVPRNLLAFHRLDVDGRMAWNRYATARVLLYEYGDGFAVVLVWPFGEVSRAWWQCGADEFGENPVEALVDRAFSRWLEN